MWEVTTIDRNGRPLGHRRTFGTLAEAQRFRARMRFVKSQTLAPVWRGDALDTPTFEAVERALDLLALTIKHDRAPRDPGWGYSVYNRLEMRVGRFTTLEGSAAFARRELAKKL